MNPRRQRRVYGRLLRERLLSGVTHLTTAGTVVAVLTGSASRLDASAAGHGAAFPCRPGRPVDVRWAGQVFITVPGKREQRPHEISTFNKIYRTPF